MDCCVACDYKANPTTLQAVTPDLYDFQHRFGKRRRLLLERQHVLLPVLRVGKPRERLRERRVRPPAGDPGGVVDHSQRAECFDEVQFAVVEVMKLAVTAQ